MKPSCEVEMQAPLLGQKFRHNEQHYEWANKHAPAGLAERRRAQGRGCRKGSPSNRENFCVHGASTAEIYEVTYQCIC